MKQQKTTQEIDFPAQTVRVVRGIFDMAKDLSVDEKERLNHLREAALDFAPIIDDQATVLHHDLAHNLTEYILLKIEDDGTDPSGWVRMYERDTQKILAHLEEELGDHDN